MKNDRRRPALRPVESKNDMVGREDGTKSEHPAFAVIQANRVEGGIVLFGSEFQHRRFVRIRIAGATLYRQLSHDWVYGHQTQPYIEVSMSEAQWASFVSSMNVGTGVACTLNYRQPAANDDPTVGEIPEIEPSVSRHEQFKEELAETMETVMGKLRDLVAMVDEPDVSMPKKTRDALRGKVTAAMRNLAENLPFVVKSAEQQVEETAAKARIEINAYLVATMQQAGLAHLGEQAKPIALLSVTSPDTPAGDDDKGEA